MLKRTLSMLLCILMLCSMIPLTAMTASAAAEPVSCDIKISKFNLTTKSMSEPTIDYAGGMFYDGTSITINGEKYGPGDQFPEGALSEGDYKTVTIQFTPISGCYFVTESDGTSYAGKVTIGNQELTAYVNSKGTLKVMFRMYVNSADITSDITFTGVDAPVDGGNADLTGKGKFSHSGLNITMVDYAYRLPGKNQWYFYTEEKLDSDFSCERFALCVMYEVDPIYNITGFVNKITWNGKGVDAYQPLTNGKGYAIYFYCDITDDITQITITDIEIPVHGATPDRTGTASDGIEITKIQYILNSDRSGEYEGTYDAVKHVGDDQLLLGVEIKAKDGFSYDPATVAVVCNGQNYTIRVNRDDGKYVFVFPLDIEPCVIENVEFLDVEPAVDGATPDTSVSVPEGVELLDAHYVVKSDSLEHFTGKFDSSKHFGDDAIEFHVEVKPEAGYRFNNYTMFTCNGSLPSASMSLGDGSRTLVYDIVIEESLKNPFTDVAEGKWYYNSVIWAVASGITGGTSATTFSPKMICTRAQAVQFIWTAAGKPEPTTTANPFTDVAEGKWYYDAVMWAVENGITAGTSPTTFSPNMECTRSQIVTFLWTADGNEIVDSANPFTDVAEGKWYYNAVMWAVENGITGGTSATTFSPNTKCDRSQIVTFIQKCAQLGALEIVAQPQTYQMTSSQEDASYTVNVRGEGYPYTYTWHVLMDNDEYVEIHKNAAISNTFSYEFTDYDFENYRAISVWCEIEDSYGDTVQTNFVTVISKDGQSMVMDPISIVTQPKNYQMTSSQEDAAFAVSISGGQAPYSYRWYVEKDNDQYNELHTTNAVADTFLYEFSDYDFEDYRDITVYCIIEDASGQTLKTNYVYPLMKPDPLSIVTQPKDYQMTSSQEDAAFAVSVSGGLAPYTYTWYVFKDGGEERFVSETSAVSDTFTYEFTDYDFEQFRDMYVWCVIKDASGQTVQTNYVFPLQK